MSLRARCLGLVLLGWFARTAFAAETDAIVQGSIDREVVRRVVRANLGAVRRCYETRLAHNPELAGKLVLKWVIGPKGNVTTVQVASSSTNDAELDRCVSAFVHTWTFPAPAGGGIVMITYPFNFASANGSSGGRRDAQNVDGTMPPMVSNRLVADRQHNLLVDEGRVPYRVASGPSLELDLSIVSVVGETFPNVVRVRLGEQTYEAALVGKGSYTLDAKTLTPVGSAPAFAGFPPLSFGLLMLGRKHGDKFTEQWTATLQIVK